MKAAGIYIRVSSESQAEDDKASVPTQTADSQTVCKRHDYMTIDEYSDIQRYRATRGRDQGKIVEPSSERKDRPEYLRLCESIKAGKIDVVVAQCWDRLAAGGSVEVLLDAIEVAPNDVVIHTAWEGVMNKMMLRIMAATRAEENERRRQRVLMAGKSRLESGRPYGGYRKFGFDYHSKTGTWTINQDEAFWVEKIYGWYVRGIPMTEIKDRLVQNDVTQRYPTKRPWQPRIIRKILKNPAYKGIVRIEWDGQIYELECPRIVSDELWRKAQQTLEKNNTWRARNTKLPYLLAGILRCADCGNRLYSSGTLYYYRDGKKFLRKTPVRRYQCHTDKWSVNAKMIETVVWQEIFQFVLEPDRLTDHVMGRIREMEANREDRQGEVGRLTAKLEKLDEERQWLVTQARKRIVTQKDFERELGLLTIEQETLSRELDEVNFEIRELPDIEGITERWLRYEQEIWDQERFGELHDPDFELQKETLHTLVDEVIINVEKGELCIKGTLERVVLFEGPQVCLPSLEWNITVLLPRTLSENFHNARQTELTAVPLYF